MDLSGWALTEHPAQQPVFSSVKIPSGTKLAAHAFYLLGLSTSGLAVPAHQGDTTIHVRSTAGMSVGDTVEIDSGAGVETRKIASLGTAAGNSTTLWQPLPDGPVITIPAGSTNVPFTGGGGGPFGGGGGGPFGGGGGFAVEVGQKLGIGYGATYPAVGCSVEAYEVVTVTDGGKPGTQAYLAADAKAGDTSLKVSSVGSISVGDQIRLDIDSVGHGVETVTITKVGTASTGSPGNGRVRDPGTGLELASPLKFNHAANLPFSVRGTGISFQPATAYAHSSNEPLQPLGTGITLDRPLAGDHAINAVVRDAAVTTAGYQGPPAPNQWFGGPALSPSAGTMVLRDAAGLVVDSLNYGSLVDPWAAEGYQAASGAGQGGCFVPAPGSARGGFGGRGRPAPAATSRSAGRFPDGADTGSNCRDFLLQATTTLAVGSDAGANNIKVASMDFAAGQTIFVDAGANRETAVVAAVGTAGGTTVRAATEVGATVIPVAGAFGFNPGQTITIASGANRETAVVAAIAGGRGGPGGGRGGPGGATITVAAPLTLAHAVGAQVAGSGITLATALTRAHDSGAQVAGDVPTPGASNRYYKQ